MRDLSLYIIILVFSLYAALGILEKAMHRRHLRNIPLRVLVNGTRGKSTVTRLIAAMLREAGIRTWGKSTGSQAVILYPDGTEAPYRKPHRLVNIREQIPFVRRASADEAQAIVVECMALSPENQRMMGREFIQPTFTLITNAWVDHVSEIGRTEEETVATLALSVPDASTLITPDRRFETCGKRCAPLIPTAEAEALVPMFSYEMFPENLQLALTLADLLRIDRETAVRGLLKARPDMGMRGPFRVGLCSVVNGFAANDVTSAWKLLERARQGQPRDKTVWLLFNNRADREFRLSSFLPLVRRLEEQGAGLRVIGDHAEKAARYFTRNSRIEALPLRQKPEDWVLGLSREACLVFCFGNIRGEGYRFIEALSQGKGESVCCSKP